MKRVLLALATVGVIGLAVAVAFFVLSWQIGRDVRATVSVATAEAPGASGDPVSALVAHVQEDANGLRERNRAIWALGQLGDPRALPLLEGLATRAACDHDHELCQHGIEKAIAACRGGRNLPANLWRRGELAKGGDGTPPM